MTMRNERPSALMGRSVPRLEDGKLLRGAGRFVDDIDLPDMLHATFVRSPVAHGLLQRVDPHKARAMPGIRAVLTYADLRPVLACDRIPDGELPRVDAGFNEREEVEVEVEAPIVAVHVDHKPRPVVHLNGRDAHRPILPRAVQSAA